MSALMEDGQLLQASFSSMEHADALTVGTIVRGKIIQKQKSVSAFFVQVSSNETAYLPFSECPDGGEHMKLGDEITVQILKAAVKTKQCVATCYFSLTGKYIVMQALDTKKAYSRKLKPKQVKRLKDILTEIDADIPYGYIVRTNAMELTDGQLLLDEIKACSARLSEIVSYMHQRTLYSVLYEELPHYMTQLRDTKDSLYETVYTDLPQVYDRLMGEPSLGASIQAKVKFYEPQHQVMSLLNAFRLGEKLDEALGKKVYLKCGGTLIIEYTEAMTVIDVNSGKSESKKDQEAQNVKINAQAAVEVMHQMRLRNLCGMILVDFINMSLPQNNADLLILLRRLALEDPVHVTIVDMTPLGIVEITRTKVNKTLLEEYNDSKQER